MSQSSAPFIQGSIFKHVAVMTLTGALGLMTLFVVDLADLYFLSSLNNTNITAAIGFAGALAFANLSLSIGAGIASAALVARNLGAGQVQRAKEFSTGGMAVSLAFSAVYTLLIDLLIGPILNVMGAVGETAWQAKIFIWTASPGFIFLGGALACSFSLRGLGDAKRAMYITLSSAIITLILDPIFIFVFGWGIVGAGAANAISYALCFCVGLYSLRGVHKFYAPFSYTSFRRDFPAIWAIAFPTVVAQLATPFAAAYMNYAMAPYGDAIVAAGTVVNRVVPVAFGVVFALSGAVGPIIGQNFGAKNFPRVKRTLRDGLIFAIIYSSVMAILIFLLHDKIIAAFHVTDRAADLVRFFTTWIAASWAFIGGLFVASAAFNNLGKPVYSTWANWGRATLGTIPFAIAGAAWGGPEGIMVGTAIGGAIFGLGAMIVAYRLVNKISGGQPSGV